MIQAILARPLVLVLALCLGCAELAAGDRYDRLEEQLNGLVKTEATMSSIARGWGLPEQRDKIGASEFWVYVIDEGTTHRASTGPFGVARGSSTHHYDKITLEFVRGVLVGYTVDTR